MSWFSTELFTRLSNCFFRPNVDMMQSLYGVEIKAELPGLNKGDIKLEIEGDRLYIRGEKKAQNNARDDRGYYFLECNSGRFHRSVALPYPVYHMGDVRADYEKGVLTVCIAPPDPALCH